MKNLNKNIRREFSSSIARFVSVSALLMLGVFVFIGLNVTGSNMRATAQTAYAREHLAAAKVSSTTDLSAQDRRVIRDLKHARTVEFGHTTDVLLGSGTKKALQVDSQPGKLSQYTLTAGHRPRTSSQIVLSKSLRGTYHLGDTIRLKAAKAGGSYALGHQRFTVVGFATSTEYLKTDNVGSTAAGTGSLVGFAYVTKSAFTSSEPNVARLDFNNVSGVAYASTYENQVKKDVDAVQATLKKQNTKRVNASRTKLTTAITTAEANIATQTTALATAKTQLAAAKAQLTAAGQPTSSLATQEKTLATNEKRLAAAKASVATAKVTRQELSNVTMTIEGRNDYNAGYADYGEDSQRIDALGYSFPIFFFLIAILVSFTTMQRMVEEKRIEMGTLRALGFTTGEVMREFLLYSVSAAIVGTVLGSLLGLWLLPKVIFNTYTVNFSFTAIQLSLHPVYILISFAIALFSTVLASWLAAHSALKIIPAELMLPKPPASGSRILLERITPIWSRLSFSWKVTARNLFRYKSRMFMTIVGVAGATALMITGFGIKDSLTTIVDRQFQDITKYDVVAIYNPDAATSVIKKAVNTINTDSKVRRTTGAYFASVYANRKGDYARDDISLMVAERPSQLRRYIKLNSASTGKALTLSDHGAIISQKLAKLHGLTVGDYLTIHETNGATHKLKISGITTMYAGHYLYLNNTYYRHVFGDTPQQNALLVTTTSSSKATVNALSAEFNRQTAAVETVQTQETKQSITNILNNLNNLIIVIVLAASLLSLVVLYTLTNINVSERMRELSTLKVLGFYPNEVLMYIYRETNVLTGIAIVVGIGGGYAFHAYIMSILPPATAMVAPGLNWLYIVTAVLLTIVFSLIVMFLMNHKIQQVDMLEALKSVD